MTKKLLVVAHAPSKNTQALLSALLDGAKECKSSELEIIQRAPLETSSQDLLNANAIIIGTTENLGYMAGLIKDVFDRTYYDCLEHTQGKPFTFYIRAGHDGTGTRRAIESITTGLRWRIVQDPLTFRGDWQDSFLEQAKELGMYMAASLDAGII